MLNFHINHSRSSYILNNHIRRFINHSNKISLGGIFSHLSLYWRSICLREELRVFHTTDLSAQYSYSHFILGEFLA